MVKTKGSTDCLRQPRAPEGIAICDICVTFDRCDGVIVFQARHEKIALNSAIEIGFAANYRIETLGALPVKEL